MDQPKTTLDWALLYASWGWKIFPGAPGRKDCPLVKWGLGASSDQRQVRRWWTEHPTANIYMAVGQSGLAAVDLDVKRGVDGPGNWALLQLERGECPPTRATRTASGGRHELYRGEVGNTQGKEGTALGPGIDTRGRNGFGGYILLPPSAVEGVGPYTWASAPDHPIAPLPKWVSDMAGARAEAREHDDAAVVELDQPKNIRWARTHLERDARPAVEGSGGDMQTFYVACTLREQGVSEETAFELMSELYNERCTPPWTEEELRAKCKNAFAYASVSRPGSNTAEAHFGSGGDDWGAAGPPPDPFPGFVHHAPPADEAADKKGPSDDPRYVGTLDEWVYVSQQQIFMRRSDKFIFGVGSFDSHFGYMVEGKGKLSTQLFGQRHGIRKRETVAFLPGEPEFPGAIYNTWTEPRVKAARGDVSAWLRHTEHVVPDDRERAEVERWMAWVVQNPTLKPNYALLMQGKVGCGKSIFGAVMRVMCGESNTTQLRTEDVGNRFNSWVLHTRLGVVEELMGDDKRTLANRMKALVTQDFVSVELKGKDLLTCPNKCAFMCFTNHEDALRLENEDRRYFVVMSPAPSGREMGMPFFDDVWRFARSDEGPAALLWHLLHEVEVPRDYCLGASPMTAGHESMRRAGMGEVEQWMLEQFELANEPFDRDLIAMSDVEQAMPDRLRRTHGLHKIISPFLKNELGARDLGPHRLGSGLPQKRLWSLRRHEVLAQRSPSGRAERYMAGGAATRPTTGKARQDEFPDLDESPAD